MTTRGRLVSRLLAVLIAFAVSVGLSALPATAGDSRTRQYVALGDSYAAGQGGGGETLDEACKRTTAAYPEQLDSRKHVHLRANVGCSGDTTFDVIATQVSALDEDWTTLVTLTVGANNLGVANVAAACTAVPPTNCEAAIANALGQLTPLAGSLSNLYTAVDTAAPRALILVTGYPYLFETPTPCILPTDSIVCQIRYATTLLNTTIKDTVETAKTAGVNIEYVDVTAAFTGHGINSSEPFINGPLQADSYHPNGDGYKAYAEAISAAL
jgi:lysophospholipase L1-like esterase